jgi:hypothetical protein
MNTKNNWLTYFYVDADWQPSSDYIRTNLDQQCSTLITPYEFEKDHNIWHSVCNTAREMYSQFGEIQIGYSGGLDSELAVLSFYHQKIPFKLSTVEWYWGDTLMNGHDIRYAYRLCNELNLKTEVIKYDLKKLFLTDEWERIACTYQSVSPCQQALLAILEKINTPWLQVDEIETLISFEDTIPKWVFEEREDQDMCWRKFNQITGLPALSNFFTYRLETIDIWYKNQTVQDLINFKMYGKLGFVSSKHKIYQEHCPYKLIPRPKYFGLESMVSLWDNNIVDRIDMPTIDNLMHIPATEFCNIIEKQRSYSNVHYKKTRLPRSI